MSRFVGEPLLEPGSTVATSVAGEKELSLLEDSAVAVFGAMEEMGDGERFGEVGDGVFAFGGTGSDDGGTGVALLKCKYKYCFIPFYQIFI